VYSLCISAGIGVVSLEAHFQAVKIRNVPEILSDPMLVTATMAVMWLPI
jgi:hypothetical protein